MIEKLNIFAAFANILASGKIILDWIMAHPLLMTMFCGSIVSLACYFIVKIKKVARG